MCLVGIVGYTRRIVAMKPGRSRGFDVEVDWGA